MTALGVDFGGTKVLACVVEGGRMLARVTRPTGRSTGPGDALGLLVEVASELRAHAPRGFDACGIAFPGLVDRARGVVLSSVMLDGWSQVPLAERAARAIGVRCVVDNDVNAAAVAEVAARGDAVPGSMLLVMVGTGIGGAIVLGGRVLRGASGVAGEIGNTTIRDDGPEC